MTFFLPTLTLNRRKSEFDHDDNIGRVDEKDPLDHIFRQLQIHSRECRSKLICQVVENPTQFEPLSNIIFLLFR